MAPAVIVSTDALRNDVSGSNVLYGALFTCIQMPTVSTPSPSNCNENKNSLNTTINLEWKNNKILNLYTQYKVFQYKSI